MSPGNEEFVRNLEGDPNCAREYIPGISANPRSTSPVVPSSQPSPERSFVAASSSGEARELPGFGAGADFEKFRAKVTQFLKANENHSTIHKLRFNEPLTPNDIRQLEKMLLEAGAGTPDDINRAKEENHKLGLFLRSLVGLDREAAKRSIDGFLWGNT